MEAQFQKALENFDSYKRNSHYFVSEIEKGSPGILNTLVNEVEFIITQDDQRIIKKILAARFCKDIMVLGRLDIIKSLQKIVPQIVQVCKHRSDQQSPDRGQTFFNKHPQYIRGTLQQKRQIQMYASTYFTLNLQSILHWAKWIPSDQNGNQSIYSQQYTKLLKIGIKFHTNYLYYKLSDTERFKNTYKMQFFSQSSFMDDQSNSSQKGSKMSFKSKSKISNFQDFSKQLTNIQKIKNQINFLNPQTKENLHKLDIINLNSLTIFQAKYMNDNIKCSNKQNQQKRWLERYIIHYSLLKNKKLSYVQFMNKITCEIISLPSQQQNLSQNDFKERNKQTFLKSKKTMPVNISNDQKNHYEELFKKQEQQYNKELDSLKKIKQVKQKQIQILKKKFQRNQQIFKNEYQERINTIKRSIMESQYDKTQHILLQNEKLKERIFEFEKQKMLKNSMKFTQKEKEKQINSQIKKLYKEVQIVKAQNQKLKTKIYNSGNNQIYINRIKELERELEKEKKQKQSLLRDNSKQNVMDSSFQLKKKNKQLQNLTDQVRIYKNQLTNQRVKSDKKYRNLQNKLLQIQSDNKSYKQKISKLQKQLDLRDIQSAQLNKQINLYKTFDKQMYILQEQERQRSMNQNLKITKNLQSPKKSTQKDISFKYNIYKNLRNNFKENRQSFLRFCRCCLKKKDLLLKQNDLQIGLISQVLTSYEMTFIIHLTNMSNSQFENIQINIENDNSYEIQLSTQFIFCIQRQQQEKIIINCKSRTNKLLQFPIILLFSYEINQKLYHTKLNLPFINYKLFKFLQTKEDDCLQYDKRQSIKVNYSKKIISEPKYLKNYFPPLKQVQDKKYQVNLFHIITKQIIRVSFSFQKQQQVKIFAIPIDQQEQMYGKQQQQILFNLISFLEFIFKK